MNEERRRAYRIPVLPPQQPATLRIGDAEVAVRLLDQSATGFSVLADQHPGAFAGETVWLKSDVGWTRVRVVKVRHNEDGTRIGLERLGEAHDTPKRDRSANQVLGDSLKQAPPQNCAGTFITWGVAFAVVVGLLIWAGSAKYVRFGSFTLVNTQSDGYQPAVTAVQNMAVQQRMQMRQAVEQFGASMMALPDVARQLQLTPSQQHQLLVVLGELREAENALRRKTGGRPESHEVARLRESTSRKALTFLTAEQQARWQTMVDAAIGAVDPLSKAN